MVPRIIIAGAGIAGLTTALALARRGHRVHVIERRADPDEAGAGLQLSPNASHVLVRLGLSSGLAPVAVAPDRLVIRRGDEPRAFATMPMSPGSEGNAPFWVMLRADLHGALLEACRREPGITFAFGVALEGARRRDGQIEADLAVDGRSAERVFTPLLIGADGLRSRVRRAMGDARGPRFAGYEAWRALLEPAAVADFARLAHVNLWLMPHMHVVHYPVAAGRLVNLVVLRATKQELDGWNREADVRELKPALARVCGTLRDLVAAAPGWQRWTLFDRTPGPVLAGGGMALVGDAAHPTLPFFAQGAAMAIEDAAVLAHYLPPPEGWSAEKCEAGLRNYTTARSRRTARVVREARFNAWSYHLGEPMASLRDRVLRHLEPDGLRDRYAWVYDWRAPETGADAVRARALA